MKVVHGCRWSTSEVLDVKVSGVKGVKQGCSIAKVPPYA